MFCFELFKDVCAESILLFNDVNWELNYPDIAVKRFSTSDSTKVYTLTDKATNKSVSVALNSCTLPAGI